MNASPANTTSPTRSPPSRSRSAVTSSLARSMRDGFTSRASMLFEASRAMTRSMPVRLTTSVRSPYCGAAAATSSRNIPSPSSDPRATLCAAPAPRSTCSNRAAGTSAASRRCRCQARTTANAPAARASGAIQRKSGVRMRTCWPSTVVWMPVMLRRPLQPCAPQRDPEQAEESGRGEEARVPLVVVPAAAGVVDLALLQAVEHGEEPLLEGLLVGCRRERAAGRRRDLLEQLRIHVDLDRLVGGAAEEIGAGRVGDAAALADEDGEDLDAEVLRDARGLQRREV